MAGFFKTLFGKSKKHPDELQVSTTTKAAGSTATSTNAPDDGCDSAKTRTASQVAESGQRVEPVRSDQMSPNRTGPSDEGDTGPWHIGKTVGEMFQIREVLGQGGMGIVYRGFDTATQRNVAVKVPLGKFVDDHGARKRFAREAEAWTALVYPHIVHAFDVRDDQTTDYRPAIFMDYCDGGSLAERLRQGQLSMAEALDIAIQVCWAMEFAQEKGYIHRDLKPGNVLLTSDGRALVSDFGLVKQIDLEDVGVGEGGLESCDGELLASITRGAAGTPEYMPPEQWEGNACQRSDIYAFGIILYELFCGRRPFSAKRRADLRGIHIGVAPPEPLRLNGQIPDGLSELMFQCLAKDPSDRPAGFSELAARLETAYVEAAKGALHRKKPDAEGVSREDEDTHAWALIRLGNGSWLRGDLSDANRHFTKATAIFEKSGNKDGLQASLTGQALILKDLGRLDEAMDLYKRQEAICRELEIKDGLQVSLNRQALILKDLGWLDEAMDLHKQEEAICRELGDKHGLQVSLGNQALILQAWDRLDDAMDLNTQLESICRELGDNDGLARSLVNQASLLDLGRGKVREAIPLAEEAYRLAAESGFASLAEQIQGFLDKIRTKNAT